MTDFMNASDYSDLKMITENAMPLVGTITRRGAFVDQGGGSGYYEPAASVEFSCRVSPLGTPEERRVADQLQEAGLEVMVVPKGTPIQMDDNEIALSNGKVYDVRGKVPLATYSIHERYLVKANG